MSEFEDDPERRFRAWPRGALRWTANTAWRRLRLPIRRHRWQAKNAADVAPYAKPATAEAGGPVLAMGDFSGSTGLCRAARYELDRLREEHGEVEVIDMADAGAPVAEGPPVGTLYLLSAPDTYGRLLARVPAARIAGAYRVGLWVWETPIFPDDWRFALDIVHEIWTPSAYSRIGIAQGAGDIPVLLRPHHVLAERVQTRLDRAAFGLPEDAFLGLAIMDICSCPARKNPWAHIAAWKAAFGAAEDRVLVLKIRVSKRTRCILAELREMAHGHPNIRILEAELTNREIAELQQEADVYLSLHRAEGYGLNIRECLELGTPVLATDFSANAEYGPVFAKYHPLPYRLVPYRDWTAHYPNGGFNWAEVRIEPAARRLRQIADDWTTARLAAAAAPEAVPA